MDAKSVRNMYSIIAVTNKHTAKLHHVGSLYILTYDARKPKYKFTHLQRSVITLGTNRINILLTKCSNNQLQFITDTVCVHSVVRAEYTVEAAYYNRG